jgi:hypothetical protein
VLCRLPDGSWQSRFGVPVPVIDAEITIATSAGHYRLITTLADHAGYLAGDLVSLCHERWEIESAYLELKSTILGVRPTDRRSASPVSISRSFGLALWNEVPLRCGRHAGDDVDFNEYAPQR